MAAYVIAHVNFANPVAFEEYRKLAAPTVAPYGGKFLVCGGAVERLEGVWSPKHFVVLEFENAALAKRWWESEEYSVPKRIRHETAITDMVVVESV